MMDNLLIDLPELKLPRDFARRVRFVEAVEEHIAAMGVKGRYVPERFVGYYFAGALPVAVSGEWAVVLDQGEILRDLRRLVDRITEGRFSIESRLEHEPPEFILVHDTFDGSCWLWEYRNGRRFLETREPFCWDPVGNSESPPLDDGPRSLWS